MKRIYNNIKSRDISNIATRYVVDAKIVTPVKAKLDLMYRQKIIGNKKRKEK